MTESMAKFKVGQLVHHKLFGYRGVVLDVDPEFKGTHSWYQSVARSKPPRDRPWYHVLVHELGHQTYVAERNLEPDEEGGAIDHPEVGTHFGPLGKDGYTPKRRIH